MSGVNFFPINAPGMGRFQLLNLGVLGYRLELRFWVDRITQHLDKGTTPINVYLGLSKAFDTLDHNILLHKLKYYGIEGTALLLFESYLN